VPDAASGAGVDVVLAALGRGAAADPVELAGRLVRSQPGVAAHWYAYSEALLACGRPPEAVEAARRALALEPGHAFLTAQMAYCLLRLGEFRESLIVAEQALQRCPASAVTFDRLGQVYAACDEHAKARAMFEQAVARAPRELHFQFNLATALRNSGDFESAERIYDGIIARSPTDWEAWKNRSDLRTQTAARNHVDALKDVLVRACATPSGEVMIASALAKELEDLGEDSAAFEYVHRANRRRRRGMRYDVAREIAELSDIETSYPPSAFRELRGYDSDEPIFIVGLPRTGSTLLERIVGSHSSVFAAGELQNFGIVQRRLARAAGAPTTGFPAAQAARLVDPSVLGEQYVLSTRPRTGTTAHFIDKLPSNFIHVGAIHRALPRARILHVTRSPLEAAYAIYKTQFKEGYPWSYDPDDLVAYYCAYRRLMAHWHSCLPGVILDVPYESLVEDTEATIESVIRHCGLALEPACRAFHRNSAPSSTASAAQVRQPIYATSLHRAARLEKELAPLIDRLRAAGYLAEQS
jgi:tetratricopeptide (TPR) repeat protein